AAPPRFIRAALARGRRDDPANRHPSMEALLRELARDPMRIAARAGVATLAGAAALAGWMIAARPAARCSGGDLQPVWHEGVRASVATAFRKTGSPHADETFARVDAALRARVAEWSEVHKDACEATFVRHEQSDTLLDLRMRCLAQARSEVV